MACKSSAQSTCAVDFPSEIKLCSCETKTFTFTFPICNFLAASFSYKIDAGIHLRLLHNDTDYVQIAVSADANTEGSASLSISWCDDTGYGTKDITCHVSPDTPPTPTQAPYPSAGSNQTQECGPDGPASSCKVVGPTFFSATAGQPYTFGVSLSCPAAQVNSDWGVSNALCKVSSSFDSTLNPTYIVTCATNIAKKATGIIQTQWCDKNGGFLSFTTNYEFKALPKSNYPTLPPPPPSAVDKCRYKKSSSCSVVGPNFISVTAGKNSTFSVTLQCPVQSCYSHWTATFATCLVKADYYAVNPTFTIIAPRGAQGRGGSINVEWCDKENGYFNWTTNFMVNGAPANAYDQEAALVGVMAQGDSEANANGGNNPEYAGWVIFLFVVLGLVVLGALCAIGRLCYMKKQSKTSPYSGNRRSSDPQNDHDFATVEGESPPHQNRTVPHQTRTGHQPVTTDDLGV
jgi:hypothetical protein